MATAGLPLWSTTAASNSTADPSVNFAEGMAPSAVNDSARALMASVAKWRDDLYGVTTGLTTGGTSTAFTVTTNATYASASVMNGAVFSIIPHTDSGVAPTLAVDGLTARALNSSSGVAIPTAALKSGTPYFVRYVHATTEFIVISPALIASQLSIVNNLTEDTSPDSSADFLLSYDDSAAAAKKIKLQNIPVVLPRGYIDGCILSNSAGDTTNDIDIAAGVCRDSTNAVNITVPAISGKQLDANWASGGSAGMRNSAIGIANGTYHIWAARTAASATGDIYAHTSATAATVLTALQAETGGSSYAYLRHIGSIVRVSGSISLFIQDACYPDYFAFKTPVLDHNSQPASTSAITITLGSLPTGIKVIADIGAAINAGTTGGGLTGWFSDLSSTDVGPTTDMYHVTSAAGANAHAIMRMPVVTNTSAQIRGRLSHSGASDAIRAITYGFRHPRGRT